MSVLFPWQGFVRILYLPLLLLVPAATRAVPPEMNYLLPAGAGRGESVVVTAAGSFSHWPPRVWVDRDGIRVQPDEKKGQLKVAVAADAVGGVYWIRLSDKEGATELRPFIVGTLPDVAEAEPNDDPLKPQVLTESATVNGKLGKGGDVDTFAIRLAKDQTLVAAVDANRVLGSPMDAVLQLCNDRGFVLAQNDDERGIDPLIVFRAPSDGVYLVRTFAFPATPNSTIGFAGGANFVYRLTITTGGFVDHAFPLAISADGTSDVELSGWNVPNDEHTTSAEPIAEQDTVTVFHPDMAGWLDLPVTSLRCVIASDDNSVENPQTIELPSLVTGRIEAPRDVDVFQLQAKKAQRIVCRLESRSLGYPLDAVLQVTDASGKSLAEVDDVSKQRDPSLTFTAPADGQYRVLVRDVNRFGGFRFVYRLTVEQQVPDFELKVAGSSFVFTPGKPLEIPVTIERKNGFADEIEVSATALPRGVSAESVKSMPKGDTAKTVKLRLSADGDAMSGEFRIVGGARDNPRKHARFNVSGLDAAHRDIWLTVKQGSDKKDAPK